MQGPLWAALGQHSLRRFCTLEGKVGLVVRYVGCRIIVVLLSCCHFGCLSILAASKRHLWSTYDDRR